MVRFRRHHNTKGFRAIRRGKTAKEVKEMERRFFEEVRMKNQKTAPAAGTTEATKEKNESSISAPTIDSSSEIRDLLENDPIFRRTTEMMIADIMDNPPDDNDGSVEGYALRVSKQLLEPHIHNLQISVIDAFEAGYLRNFLIWHNGLRRMIEIGIESVPNDSISQRIKGFGQRKQRVLAIDDKIDEEADESQYEPDPDQLAHDPDLPPPSEVKL